MGHDCSDPPIAILYPRAKGGNAAAPSCWHSEKAEKRSPPPSWSRTPGITRITKPGSQARGPRAPAKTAMRRTGARTQTGSLSGLQTSCLDVQHP